MNMDTIEFNYDVIENLKKLSDVGMTFVGYSSKNINVADVEISGVNLIAVVPNCPKTKSKVVIDNVADIDRIMLET